MLGAVVSRQCFSNRLFGGSAANIAVRRELFGSMSASDNRSNNAKARSSGDVRHDMVKLHVHLHQSLLHVLHVGGRVFNHPLSKAQVRPQLSDAGTGAKASAKKSVLVKLLQPLSIIDVCLSTRHVLHVTGVHQKYLEAASLENLEDRDPIHARGLHCNRLDSDSREPVRHLVEISTEASERAHRLFILVAADRNDMKCRANVQPRRVLIDCGKTA
jgi:hypothetical protein